MIKKNPAYIVKAIMDETVIIPTGNAIENFNGMISTNEVAGFIWQNIDGCESVEAMIELVLEEFDVDRKTASEDVTGFLKTLKELGMIAY